MNNMNNIENKQINSDSASAIVTPDHRVQIPTEVLKKVNIANGNAYDIYCNGKLKLRKICADGSLRVGDASSLPAGATAIIIVKDNVIYITT